MPQMRRCGSVAVFGGLLQQLFRWRQIGDGIHVVQMEEGKRGLGF